MQLSNSYYNNFQNLNKEYNTVAKEIATGKKEINSSELANVLPQKEEVSQYTFSNKKIQENEITRETNDDTLSSIKDTIDFIRTELIKANTATTSPEAKKIINETIQNAKDDIQNKGQNLKEDRLLIAPNNYMNIGTTLSDLNTDTKTIDEIFQDIETALNSNDNTLMQDSMADVDNLFNKVNAEHSKIGYENKSLNNRLDYNSERILNLKQSISGVEGADITESIMKMKQIETTYQAMASVLRTESELSLVKYL